MAKGLEHQGNGWEHLIWLREDSRDEPKHIIELRKNTCIDLWIYFLEGYHTEVGFDNQIFSDLLFA